MTINLSILDFKLTKSQTIAGIFFTINLSILDFKLVLAAMTAELGSVYKSIHIGF